MCHLSHRYASRRDSEPKESKAGRELVRIIVTLVRGAKQSGHTGTEGLGQVTEIQSAETRKLG